MKDQQSDEQLIQDVTAVMNAEADAQFSAEHLARQQARILQRIDQDGRPGRVIAFPAAEAAGMSRILRTSPSARWVAAAAALAFIVGLLAGQRLPHDLQLAPASQIAATTVAKPTGTALRGSASLASTDDEFLGEVEIAGESRPTVLQHIDALTPRAWEVEVGR